MEEDELDPRLIAIGEKLKQLRLDAKYTNAEKFSHAHDLNRVTYYKLERGSGFNINTLFRVLDAHKMTLEEFFKGIE